MPRRRKPTTIAGARAASGVRWPVCGTCSITEAGPYIVPMNFGYSFDGQRFTFCMHSAKAGKKLDLLRENPSVAFELMIDGGLEEGKSPCNYGYLYECVMGRGKVRFADDPREKIELLNRIMLQHTGRCFEFTELHASAVEVFVIEAEELTAKAQRPKPVRV
jgi:nitroimidazol reductase NimA-like FMN-containing flavoprotein (pyridoxamine 5'-phosphate oxidase superfamily)